MRTGAVLVARAVLGAAVRVEVRAGRAVTDRAAARTDVAGTQLADGRHGSRGRVDLVGAVVRWQAALAQPPLDGL